MRKGAMQKRYTWDAAQLPPEKLRESLGPERVPIGKQDAQQYPKDQGTIDKAVAEWKRKKALELRETVKRIKEQGLL